MRVSSDASDESARTAAELLEKMLPVLEGNLPYKLPAGERLVVHLHTSLEGYRLAARGPGTPDRDARTLDATKESHVLLQPRADAVYLRLTAPLSELTRSALFHESARQILLRGSPPGQGSWPSWYVIGMAERAAAATLRASAGRDAPEPILLEDSLHGVQAAVADGRTIRLDRLLHDVPPSSFLTLYEHDDQWRSFYDFLATDAERLAALHERVRALPDPVAPVAPGGSDSRAVAFAAAFAAALEKVYGPLPALESRWKDWVRASKPAAWYEPLRSSQRDESGLLCASYPELESRLVRVDPAPAARFTFAVEWNLFEVGAKQVDLYLAYEEGERPRFLKLALRSDGNVTLLAQADGSWQGRYRVNVAVDRARTVADKWHTTTVTADASTLSLVIDGERVLETPVPPGYDVLGRGVGLGVYDGIARFRNLEVKPVTPGKDAPSSKDAPAPMDTPPAK